MHEVISSTFICRRGMTHDTHDVKKNVDDDLRKKSKTWETHYNKKAVVFLFFVFVLIHLLTCILVSLTVSPEPSLGLAITTIC